MTIWPLKPETKDIRINAKQCCILLRLIITFNFAYKTNIDYNQLYVLNKKKRKEKENQCIAFLLLLFGLLFYIEHSWIV